MSRIQALRLLISLGVSVALCGCLDSDPKNVASTKALSVSDYMHDIDLARARLHRAKIDGAASEGNPDVINASIAVENAMGPSAMRCWPVKPSSTANVDHGCLDKLGYVR